MPTSTTDDPPECVRAGPVVVRRVRAADAAGIAAAVGASLDHLRPWMPWATEAAADPANQLARVAEADQNWEAGLGYVYSVLTSADETLVGEAALHRRPSDNTFEIGYWIAASQARRGYAALAAGALTAEALALPAVHRVEIHCDAANVASAAVARKLGYQLDRVEQRRPEAPGESGRLMIWVLELLAAVRSAR